ncbi:hypothetical protein [Rhodococcus sp. NPDC049939]|uniref:hypothetical protein n=1 Tax=Rhodococcus sp. NPDC049939 TaxID=3155511 RepID=UPI0033DD4AD4
MMRTVVAMLATATVLLGACSSEPDNDTESAANATAEASADSLAEQALCESLLQYASAAEEHAQQNGETFDRTTALDNLFDQSAETPEWQEATPERKDQMIKAYDAAKTGVC